LRLLVVLLDLRAVLGAVRGGASVSSCFVLGLPSSTVRLRPLVSHEW
jgi:hypothetical protein